MPNGAAQGHGGDLMAVAEAQDGQAQLVDGGVNRGGVFCIDAGRAAGEDEGVCTHGGDLCGGGVAGDDL